MTALVRICEHLESAAKSLECTCIQSSDSLSDGFVAGAFSLFGTLRRVWNAVYIVSYKGLLDNY